MAHDGRGRDQGLQRLRGRIRARSNPDIVYGNWLAINPTMKDFWIAEFERLAGGDAGFFGFCQSQNSLGFPPSDPVWDPFYKLSIEANAPVLLMTGLTGIGQGTPGGGGVVLDDGHPHHVDRVAARYPELRILAGRPAWPWQDDMIAILLHKANVQYELHGWSPKYFTHRAEKGNRRTPAGPHPVRLGLADADARPADQRLARAGLFRGGLRKIFHKNAEAFFPGAAPK
jgi:predicted TIM-barrel fold metal-dependent hydrolase